MTFDVSKKNLILQINPNYPLNGDFCTNLTNLEEYNNYTIAVSAANAAGTGPESPSITHLTGQAGIILTLIYT